MIVLDTNVLSELMRPQPDAAVVVWAAAQPPVTLYTTAITQTEILYGIAIQPAGKLRAGLAAAAEAMFTEEFTGRVLSYGPDAAVRYAEIVASRRQAG